jgi:hypothetical protein
LFLGAGEKVFDLASWKALADAADEHFAAEFAPGDDLRVVFAQGPMEDIGIGDAVMNSDCSRHMRLEFSLRESIAMMGLGKVMRTYALVSYEAND